MLTAEQSFLNPHPSMIKYRRSLTPAMESAIILGERFRNYQWELLDMSGYQKLQVAVRAMQKFFDEQEKKKVSNQNRKGN